MVPGKVEVPMSWSPLMPKRCFFSLMTLEPRPSGELGNGMKFGRLLSFQLIGEKK